MPKKLKNNKVGDSNDNINLSEFGEFMTRLLFIPCLMILLLWFFIIAIMAAEEKRKQKEQIKIMKQQVCLHPGTDFYNTGVTLEIYTLCSF